MTKYSAAILLFFCVSKLYAQIFTAPQISSAINQLKTEQQLIRQNNNLSNEKKLELLTDYGLLTEASKLLNTTAANYEGQFAKAKFYKTIYLYKKALKHIEEALMLSPTQREALLLKAELLLILNQPLQAQKIAETRLATVSFDDKALIINAKAAIQLEKLSIAKSYIENALAINNHNAEAWYLKASINLPEHSEVIDALSKCLNLNPYHPKARTQLGDIHLEKGDTTAALLNWELALTKNPFHVPAHETALQIQLNKEKQVSFTEINTLLNTDDQQVKTSIKNKYINEIKNVRNILLTGNLQAGALNAYSIINKEQLPESMYHALMLEVIFANKAIDHLGKEHLGEIINSPNSNQELYYENRLTNGLINFSLGEFTTLWELLLLNRNEPKIGFYKLQQNDIAYYKLIQAISDNKELKATLMNRIYAYCMPEDLKRVFRKSLVDCAETTTADFNLQYYGFNKKNQLGQKPYCAPLDLYFIELENGIKKGGKNLDYFKAEALTKLADRLIDDGKYNEATSALQTALSLKPRYIHALLQQSELKAAQNQHEEADLWWNTAFETDPAIPEVYITAATLALYKLENGRISAETALTDYSIAYAKAISLAQDPFLFGLYNRQVQETLKLFGKYGECLQLAEVYLSKKVMDHNIFEAPFIEETKAFATGIRVGIGNGNKLLSNALNLLEQNPPNSIVHDKLYLAYTYNNQEKLILKKIKNLSPSIKQLYALKQTKSQNNPINPEFNKFLKPLDQLTYLAIITELIEKGQTNEAGKSLQNFAFSKMPEVWSNYHYTRAKLLIAEQNYGGASKALMASLEAMPVNFRSFHLLEEIYTKTQGKPLKKAIKKQKKLQKKLNVTPGNDF